MSWMCTYANVIVYCLQLKTNTIEIFFIYFLIDLFKMITDSLLIIILSHLMSALLCYDTVLI